MSTLAESSHATFSFVIDYYKKEIIGLFFIASLDCIKAYLAFTIFQIYIYFILSVTCVHVVQLQKTPYITLMGYPDNLYTQ